MGVLRESLIPASYTPDTEEKIMALPTYKVFNYLRYMNQHGTMVNKEHIRMRKEAEEEARTKTKK